MVGVFPEDVEFVMDPDFSDNTMLADNLMNQHRLVVVSGRLKAFLSDQHVPKLEFLPVAIRDHRGKIAGHYFIVHLLDPVDCLDRQASKALVNPAVKTQVMAVKRLVLLKDMLPEDRPFFRIAGYPQARLVRRDLAQLVEKEFAELTFDEIEKKA